MEDVVGIMAFLDTIYAPYMDTTKFPNGPDNFGAKPASFLTPQLVGLIEKDSSDGEVGKLDHDPLCACQDSEGLRVSQVVLHLDEDGQTASAVVSMTIGKTVHVVKLALLHVNGEWKVGDIAESGISSLVAYLGGSEEPLVAYSAESSFNKMVVYTFPREKSSLQSSHIIQ